MSRSVYLIAITLYCLLLPASVAAPYLFYGEGFKILRWAWVEGYLPFWINFLFSLSVASVCLVLLVRLNPLGRIIYTIGAVITVLGSAIMAMSEQRHLLLVVIFLLACALVYASEWIRAALDLPYFQSQRNWWESRPKSVPGISARVISESGEGAPGEPVRVVNFGKEGCFIFFDEALNDLDPNWIEFDYGDSSLLRLKVVTTIRTRDRLGMGLRFLRAVDSDEEQDLQDYLIHLRRSGYVST